MRKRYLVTRPFLVLFSVSLLFQGCGLSGDIKENPEVTQQKEFSKLEKAALELVSGDKQSAVIGHKLVDPLVIKITNEKGEPLSGRTIRMIPVEGEARALEPDKLVSNSNGIVSGIVELGDAVGNVILKVELTDSQAIKGFDKVFFSLEALAPQNPTLLPEDGSQVQIEALVASELEAPLSVVAYDETGARVAGETIEFMIEDVEGKRTKREVETDGNGMAGISTALGQKMGTMHVTADWLPNHDEDPNRMVEFTIRLLPREAQDLRFIQGHAMPDGSRICAGEGNVFEREVILEVEDSYGNRLANQIVTLEPTRLGINENAIGQKVDLTTDVNGKIAFTIMGGPVPSSYQTTGNLKAYLKSSPTLGNEFTVSITRNLYLEQLSDEIVFASEPDDFLLDVISESIYLKIKAWRACNQLAVNEVFPVYRQAKLHSCGRTYEDYVSQTVSEVEAPILKTDSAGIAREWFGPYLVQQSFIVFGYRFTVQKEMSNELSFYFLAGGCETIN